ncbi:hypothetical protein THARTR1_09896 [Trichoderma harzianum]|uniref:Uncharacterized protein n=1 Tax=Trichoderma harzianum TaxID=5544 RepID=A0A2K0TVL2_TRIHA|nr:hypothetical protein THARTR1_09896 [Trichoderma harzianum]
MDEDCLDLPGTKNLHASRSSRGLCRWIWLLSETLFRSIKSQQYGVSYSINRVKDIRKEVVVIAGGNPDISKGLDTFLSMSQMVSSFFYASKMALELAEDGTDGWRLFEGVESEVNEVPSACLFTISRTVSSMDTPFRGSLSTARLWTNRARLTVSGTVKSGSPSLAALSRSAATVNEPPTAGPIDNLPIEKLTVLPYW